MFSLGTKFSTWEKGGTHVRLKKIKQETYSLESELGLLVKTHEIFFLKKYIQTHIHICMHVCMYVKSTITLRPW